MWQCGSHLGVGWASTAGVHHIWSSTTRDQRHTFQETSSRLFPVKSLSRQPWHIQISSTVSHQPPSILPLDRSVSVNSKQWDRKPAKLCQAPAQLQLEELDFFALLPKPDRAVTVEGVRARWLMGPWLLSFLFSYIKVAISFCSPSISICSPAPHCRYEFLLSWLNFHYNCSSWFFFFSLFFCPPAVTDTVI